MNLRPLEEQFEPESVETIRELQERFAALPLEGRPARYLTAEINKCLEAGLLLAALQVALPLLELVFRERLIEAEVEKRSSHCNVPPDELSRRVREEVEDTSKLKLHQILSKLSKQGVVDPSDADQIVGFYQEVRNPFLHAIVGRLDRKYSLQGALRDLLPGPIALRDFDDMIEETALTHLDTVARFLDEYA